MSVKASRGDAITRKAATIPGKSFVLNLMLMLLLYFPTILTPETAVAFLPEKRVWIAMMRILCPPASPNNVDPAELRRRPAGFGVADTKWAHASKPRDVRE